MVQKQLHWKQGNRATSVPSLFPTGQAHMGRRSTWQPPGCLTGASVQLISFLPETGDEGLCSNAEGPSTKPGSATAPGLPEGKNWD